MPGQRRYWGVRAEGYVPHGWYGKWGWQHTVAGEVGPGWW